MSIRDLNLRDVEACVTVSHLLSVRETARYLDTEPSQVSKMIARVERELGQKLFHRSQQGMRISSFGHSVFHQFEELLAAGKQLSEVIGTNPDSLPLMTIGSLSFINQELMTRALTDLSAIEPVCRFRLVDIAPDQIVSLGLAGAFEVAIHVGKLEWTEKWTSRSLGHMRWCLYARHDHPLEESTRESEAIEYPFVIPAYWTPSGFTLGNDHCPLPAYERIKGTETSTAVTAVNAIAYTDQIAFLPEVVCRGRVESGELKKITVDGWPEYRVPVFLSVRNDLVKRRWLNQAVDLLSDGFSDPFV